MPRTPAGSLIDRQQTLVAARQETEAEIERLAREEEFLAQQVREATEQVRYYQGLLASHRKEWGKAPRLVELVRRLD